MVNVRPKRKLLINTLSAPNGQQLDSDEDDDDDDGQLV